MSIDGVDITALDEDRLAKLRGEKIGFVFQFFHLIPSLTALENVSVPMEIVGVRNARPNAERLLEEVGLTGRAHHYPSQLSGGEQQRVALARALANDPPIVLADEPTGNLDTRNGRHIMDLLRKIHSERGTTIVLVTHDAELASTAEARLVLRDGRVVESAEHDAGAPMRFVLRMAVRETRASWTRLLFFFLCIAVGVAAIVTLRSVIQSVRGVFGREAKALIAADVLVSSNIDWTPETRQTIDRRFAEFGVEEWTESVETPTMSRPSDGRPVARMVELRAVQQAFPLYGTVGLEGGQTYSHALLQRPRRAGPAGAADGAGPEGRRFAGHRQGGLHHSRRDYDRAGPPRRRLQPGTARADRLRRPGVDRSAQRRQPRAPRPAGSRAGRAHPAAGDRPAQRFPRAVRRGAVLPIDRR